MKTTMYFLTIALSMGLAGFAFGDETTQEPNQEQNMVQTEEQNKVKLHEGYKNYGQKRAAEVHERNRIRKEEHKAEKLQEKQERIKAKMERKRARLAEKAKRKSEKTADKVGEKIENASDAIGSGAARRGRR